MRQNCKQLLEEYSRSNVIGRKLNFTGISEVDVYNITAPFEDQGMTIIAGRVERRDSEKANIRFFKKVSDLEWELLSEYPSFELQDPFVSYINGELILGGVEIYPLPENPEALGWKTIFYRGKNVNELERFFEGPRGMKDLRIAELLDGRIIVLTRPQGEIGGRGEIGVTYINHLDELNEDIISNAKLLDQFIPEEWGGGNAIYTIDSDVVGVLGHIASFDDEGNRHYYSMVFTINTKTSEYSAMRIIAIRAEFQEGEAKRPDLEDIIFSGGLLELGNGKYELYVGVSDSHAQVIEIDNPFK